MRTGVLARLRAGAIAGGARPARVLAAVLVGATAVAALVADPVVTRAVTERAPATSGAYDLLVTAPGTEAVLDGYVPPALLANLPERLGLDDVARVRAVDGVEVAAPLGEVLLDVADADQVSFVVPVDRSNTTTPNPQAYRLELTWTTDDGLGERVVDHRRLVAVIDDADLPPVVDDDVAALPDGWSCTVDRQVYSADDPESAPCRTYPRTAVQVSALGTSSSFTQATAKEGLISFALGFTPRERSRVTLVDPAAERALLGEAGAFLDPLVSAAAAGADDVPSLAAWAAEQPATPFVDALRAMWERQEAARTEGPWVSYDSEEEPPWPEPPVAPVLVAAGRSPQLRLTAEVTAGFGEVGVIGGPGLQTFLPPAGVQDGVGEPVGTAVVDVSQAADPLLSRAQRVVWPGEQVPSTDRLASAQDTWGLPAVLAATTTTPVPALRESDGDRVLRPEGFVAPDRDDFWDGGVGITTASDGTPVGREAAFQDEVGTGSAAADEDGFFAGTFLAPVARYDPADLPGLLDDGTGGTAPLGLAVPAPVLVADAAGRPLRAAALRPTLAGVGLADAGATAIADVAWGEAWGADAAVSSVRVRVAPAADVDAVAAALRAEGFVVTAVAGSATRTVDVVIERYARGTDDPSGAQAVGALGTVRQEWVRVGPTHVVAAPVIGATATLRLVAVAALLLLLAPAAAGLLARRRAAAVAVGGDSLPAPADEPLGEELAPAGRPGRGAALVRVRDAWRDRVRERRARAESGVVDLTAWDGDGWDDDRWDDDRWAGDGWGPGGPGAAGWATSDASSWEGEPVRGRAGAAAGTARTRSGWAAVEDEDEGEGDGDGLAGGGEPSRDAGVPPVVAAAWAALRRRGATSQVLAPLLAALAGGAATVVAARAVVAADGSLVAGAVLAGALLPQLVLVAVVLVAAVAVLRRAARRVPVVAGAVLGAALVGVGAAAWTPVVLALVAGVMVGVLAGTTVRAAASDGDGHEVGHEPGDLSDDVGNDGGAGQADGDAADAPGDGDPHDPRTAEPAPARG
ncbi:hypothetical protein Cma02nite_22570 [Cellulomonas marina]|uniref:Uncharacterized protein n=1 Tax=Cellulomonas marina TaxID=988821 RepID=A0A1I0YDP8_9CELL|nr:hypothetical protein Cma02nite_22570 [Cellulomonas marina]SFB10906.1 hypothetical protein SAMN05421867_10751 [Cellulomonas marina]